MGEKRIDYLLSVQILRELKAMKLITEEEYIAIDRENQKSFSFEGWNV